MTRARLNRTLRRAYFILFLVLTIALVAKFADFLPGGTDTQFAKIAIGLYDYLRDMALIFVTVIAAYLASVFQKRSTFVANLEREWRGIVRTKSILYSFCEKPFSSTDDYLAAYCQISEAIDNMRIIYSNSGETSRLVGLYPYAPLHDMRRALESIDPRGRPAIPQAERELVRDAILESFRALRENMLEELDLEEPTHPLLISGGRRLKASGASWRATFLKARQRRKQDKTLCLRPDIDELLQRLYDEETNPGPPRRNPGDELP